MKKFVRAALHAAIIRSSAVRTGDNSAGFRTSSKSENPRIQSQCSKYPPTNTEIILALFIVYAILNSIQRAGGGSPVRASVIKPREGLFHLGNSTFPYPSFLSVQSCLLNLLCKTGSSFSANGPSCPCIRLSSRRMVCLTGCPRRSASCRPAMFAAFGFTLSSFVVSAS